MRYRITATLRADRWPALPNLEDRTLVVEFADLETAEAELRYIDRLREQRWGLPAIFWQSIDGKKWVLSYNDFVNVPVLKPAQPMAAATN